MDRYQYLLLMAGCVAITLPLEFLLRARVYRRPGLLVTALVPVVVVPICGLLTYEAVGWVLSVLRRLSGRSGADSDGGRRAGRAGGPETGDA